MSEEETVNSEQSTVTSPLASDLSPQEQQDSAVNEKLVPVSEAIRYRKRAQAAEKELLELKELHEKQAEELAAIRAASVSDRSGQGGSPLQSKGMGDESQTSTPSTPSPLRGTGPSQGENLNKPVKTQGVKETRTSGARTVLQTAARQAASSGSRNDVQEYLRIRRSFVKCGIVDCKL